MLDSMLTAPALFAGIIGAMVGIISTAMVSAWERAKQDRYTEQSQTWRIKGRAYRLTRQPTMDDLKNTPAMPKVTSVI